MADIKLWSESIVSSEKACLFNWARNEDCSTDNKAKFDKIETSENDMNKDAYILNKHDDG